MGFARIFVFNDLGKDVIAGIDLHPHDNSAMDVYTIIAEDMKNVESRHPVVLKVIEYISIPAGKVTYTPLRDWIMVSGRLNSRAVKVQGICNH